MEYSGSMSLKKYATRATLSLICMGLTMAVYSTTAVSQMGFVGDPAARQRVIEHGYYHCGAVNDDIRQSIEGMPQDSRDRNREPARHG